MKKKLIISMALIMVVMTILSACANDIDAQPNVSYNENDLEVTKMNYTMPQEDLLHEGTWLTWPHQYTYGIEYQNEIEDIWVQMTKALHTDENIHIIAYDKKEQTRIEKLLTNNSINMTKVDFVLSKSDDVWVRDTGPMFVFDQNNNLVIADFRFDGWGEKVEFKNDDKIPLEVAKQKNIQLIDVSEFVLEGGSAEMDGSGTLMATLSSVVSKNRNSNLTVEQVEKYLTQYLGVTNFIWLDGVIDEDITDAHIDGMARFLNDKTILTVSKSDFSELYENINMDDYSKMLNAKNANGEQYEIVTLPLTKDNVDGLDYKGSYLNYYIGNKAVLVPAYDDDNDEIALEILAELYPERKIISINVNNLYQYGGMIHCITQQQPIDK